jgi:CheY-like chemotaxis protein
LLILSKTLADNKDRNLSPDQVKYARTVHSAGNDLLALINEILDLSKVEAGKMPVNPKDVEVTEIVSYLEQTFKPVAEHKGLEFQIECERNIPADMFTDESRLQQILKNLLSNAFKFTEKGIVKLNIGRGTGVTDANMIVFSVTDTGIGIPFDKQKLIFEAFQQADGTTSRKYGGTGLGLTISREIARLLGGIIDVESEPGRGSVSRLHLPEKYVGPDVTVALDERETLLPRPKLPPDVDFAGHKILVVDDDVRNIFALNSVLKERGMQVMHAENGKLALDMLDKHKDIELILMDTMMPEMDGLEATRKIRENPIHHSIPIVSLTAKAMKGDREKCLEAGASDYITKPVDEDTLLSAIYEWLVIRKHDDANAAN